MGIRRIFRLLLLGALLAGAGVPARAADHWIVGRSQHFEMYSDETDAESRRILVALEEFRANLLRLLPLRGSSEPRTTVVVFNRDSAFRAYKPLYKGKPKDVAGYFLSRPDEVTIAMTTDLANPEMDSREVIYHEYVHLLLDARDARFPVWLNEGLAEVFSTFRVVDGKVEYGEPKNQHVAFLRQSTLWPLPRLFAVTAESPDYNESERTGMFYAESWALTHYLLFGTDTSNAKKLGRFAELLAHGDDVASAFQEAFGLDFSKLERSLRAYLNSGGYYKRGNPALAQNIPVTFRPASDVERDAALLNLRWRIRQNEDAAAAAFALLEKDPSLARPHELLAAIAVGSGDMAAAQEQWRQAAQHGSDNPWVYLQLLREALSPFQGASILDVRLPAEMIAPWRAWAARAWDLSPENHDAAEYALTIEAIADKMDLRIANRGQGQVMKMRDPARALLALAIVHWRVNQIPSSRGLLNLLESDPRAEMATRAAASALRYRFPAPAEPAAKPSSANIVVADPSVALGSARLGDATKFLDRLLAERGTTAPRVKLDPWVARAADYAQPDLWQRADQLREKANGGDVDAMFQLAVAHACGEGVEFSPELARDWMEKAAAHGHAISKAAFAPGKVEPGLIAQYLRTLERASPTGALPPLDDQLEARIAEAAAAADRHAPVALYRCAPRFPTQLRQAGGKGEALVDFTIRADGHPVNVRSAEFTDPVCAAAAEECIRGWRFLPTIRDGHPIGTLVEIAVSFEADSPKKA